MSAGECRRLHNNELYDLYCSPYIIHMIKSRRMRWVGQVACMVERKGAERVMEKKPEGNNHL
jgi:hypothetical protein